MTLVKLQAPEKARKEVQFPLNRCWLLVHSKPDGWPITLLYSEAFSFLLVGGFCGSPGAERRWKRREQMQHRCWRHLKREILLLYRTFGCMYPEMPTHWPDLHAVEERRVVPQLLFMNIHHLAHGSGHFRLKGRWLTHPRTSKPRCGHSPQRSFLPQFGWNEAFRMCISLRQLILSCVWFGTGNSFARHPLL